jgi:uncharacterized protein YjiS (DUF1127 family)
MVAQLAAGLAQRMRLRRDMRKLEEMDDRLLRDIGLSRAQIGWAVHYGRTESNWERELARMNLRQLADLPMGPEPRFIGRPSYGR